jgi:membrane protein implicated in regulation of membrane protease activity
MGAWIIWLIVAAVLGVAELLTVTLALGLLAVAALAAGIVGAAGLGFPVELGTFAAVAVAGLGVIRPIAIRHIKQPPPLRTGVAALVGKTAIVIEEVNGLSGRVRIGGEVWTSRAYDEDLVIPVGTRVDVLQIEGVTALVYPRE